MLENARAAEAADRYAERVEQSTKQATNSVNKQAASNYCRENNDSSLPPIIYGGNTVREGVGTTVGGTNVGMPRSRRKA
jgi:hypothetical protein